MVDRSAGYAVPVQRPSQLIHVESAMPDDAVTTRDPTTQEVQPAEPRQGMWSFTMQDARGVLGEFIGMTLFLFIGAGSAVANGLGGANGHLLPSLAFGVGIAVLVYAFAPVSGGHLNPAVTAGLAVTGNCRPLVALAYVLAQMVGAICGSAIILGTTPDVLTLSGDDVVKNAALNRLMPRVSEGRAVLGEITGTFLLVTVVLRTAADAGGSQKTGILAPLAIGLSVFCAHCVLIPLTNCSINPARSFGVSVVVGAFDDHWIFWVGPMAGALLAAGFYHLGYRQDAKASPPNEPAS